MMTHRERKIVKLFAEGYDTQEIARRLHTSSSDIRSHLNGLVRKLNVRSISYVIDLALKEGLITIYEVLDSRYSTGKTPG